MGKLFLRLLVGSLAVMAVAGCGQRNSASPPAGRSQTLWDNWGVPHIRAGAPLAADYAFGHAQMKSHANLLLRLYGTARGRAGEYWGKKYIDGDIYLHRLGVPERAAALYDAQAPAYQARIDAFVRGMNDYAADNPRAIDPDMTRVLPIRSTDILAHMQRVEFLTFVAGSAPYLAGRWDQPGERGSNAWAIAPEKSQSGHALLLANPHLPWRGQFLFFEAQITTPDYNAYGTTLVGFPALLIAFNDNLGWSHTVNTYDGADLYELALKDDGYVLDGVVTAFEEQEKVIKVRAEDGSLGEKRFTVRRSVHGPVIGVKGDKALALRVAGLEDLDHASLFEQYWRMGAAHDLDAFEQALRMLQQPMFNVVYADRWGDIFYAFNALQPIRNRGDVAFWKGIVDGGDSSLVWRDYRAYEALPKYRNPPGGFVQNSNDPPWTSTFPQVLRAADFPPDTAPRGMAFRPQSGARILLGDDKISFDELLEYRASTRLSLADAVLDDLIALAQRDGDPVLSEAADVLGRWDRQTRADSRGAALFHAWVQAVGPAKLRDGALFARPWLPDRPLAGPRGLADPEAALAALKTAAETLREDFGRLDVAWGEVVRVRYAGRDLPASVGPGLLGALRVGFLAPADGGQWRVTGGNSYVAAIEFGPRVKARGILAYGNASQKDSPFHGDQLDLFSQGKLRPIWFYPDEVEAHAVARETLDYVP